MIDIDSLMRRLSGKRPLFHSEFDLQFALAWELASLCPNVRLERPFRVDRKQVEVDIVVRAEQKWIAVELKYWTASLKCDNDGESYNLKQQGARDCRYGFWENVERIERLMDAKLVSEGCVVALTNDEGFWNKKSRSTSDDAFKMNTGRRVKGILRWKPGTKPGYIGTRKSEIRLRSEYEVDWQEYSEVQCQGSGSFRYTVALVQ